MATFEFQPTGESNSAKNIHRIDRFPQEALDDKKLKAEQREQAESSLVELFVASDSGPEFQNRLAGFLLKENISFDENDPYFIKMTRMLSDDRRTDNKTVAEIMRAVSSLVFILRKRMGESNDPDKERLIGFNNALDAQYSVDVMDMEYEIIDGQVVVSKLHFIDVKSFEGMAVDASSKAHRDHFELSQNFEMMARWQDTPEVDLSAKAELQQDMLASFVEDEVETLALMEACDDITAELFNIEALKEKIKENLKQEPSLEILDAMHDVLLERKQEDIDPDLIDAMDEIIAVIEQSMAEFKDKKIKRRAPVVFAPEAEVKSMLSAKKLSNGQAGGVLDSLTRDMSPLGKVLEAA